MSLFSNSLDVWHISHLELSIRIVLALVLGGLIGLEREWGRHPAGFRTHILVCLGSALVVMLSMYGFSQFKNEANVRIDPARMAAQVISGIGFLGAGTILRTGLTVSGLTTAASLWVVAAIGLAVGAGFYYGAILSTSLVLISLFLLNKIEKNFIKDSKSKEVSVTFVDEPGRLSAIIISLESTGFQVYKMKKVYLQSKQERDNNIVQVRIHLKSGSKVKMEDAINEVSSVHEILSVEIAS